MLWVSEHFVFLSENNEPIDYYLDETYRWVWAFHGQLPRKLTAR